MRIFFVIVGVCILISFFFIPKTNTYIFETHPTETLFRLTVPETITAESFLVGVIETGEIIAKKNSGRQYAIASITKLFTTYTALTLFDPQTPITISDAAVRTIGTRGELRAGTTVSLLPLLYSVLITSSNDAAEAIAETYGRDNFIKKINTLLETYGAQRTTIEDPTGLSPQNISTAKELFELLPLLSGVLSMTTVPVYEYGTYVWHSYDQYIQETTYRGGKSGYTSIAKETGITVFTHPETGLHIAIIVLASEDRYADTMQLLKALTYENN